MGRYITQSPKETEALGEKLARQLAAGDVVAFTGALGSGKTTFCRGMAAGLCTMDAVSSPTFTIANLYRGPQPFAHFDAYRIATAEDLETAGFYDYLDQGAVAAVEWSENVASFLPQPHIRVDIAALPDGSRQITIEGARGL